MKIIFIDKDDDHDAGPCFVIFVVEFLLLRRDDANRAE